jgi:hypothetical protein
VLVRLSRQLADGIIAVCSIGETDRRP